MTTDHHMPAFTPFFDWVLRATGDSSTTLAYGVIWRYAQMQGAQMRGAEKRGAQKRGAQKRGCCYAGCERLADELGWTRQRLMRHIRRLLELGLITCTNPDAAGVPREYIPAPPPPPSQPPKGPAQEPAEEESGRRAPLGGCHAASAPPKGAAQSPAEEEAVRRGPLAGCHAVAGCHAATTVPLRDIPRATPAHPPVTPRDAPCPRPSQPPVTAHDTNKTLEETHNNTQRRPEREGKASLREATTTTANASRAPDLILVQKITGKMPPRAVHERILEVLGPAPSVERLRTCYEEWCIRGYNPHNLAWLLEWYAGGSIPPNKPPGRARQRTFDDPAASPEEFARWHDYQQALQQGEDPDAAKRRLGL